MIKATRRISRATHAPCVHDVMTGTTRSAPVENLVREPIVMQGFPCLGYYEVVRGAMPVQFHPRPVEAHSCFLVTKARISPCARRAEISSPSLRARTSFNSLPWE